MLGCTVKAVRNHVSRLVNGRGGSGATPESSPAKPKTSSGKGRAAGKSPAKAAKSPATKKRKLVEGIYESESSDVDPFNTPKKIKAEEGITSVVKVENGDSVDDA